MNDDSAVAKPAVTTTGTAKTKPVNPDAPSVINKSGVPATEAASAAQTASGSETTSATQPTSDVGATGATSPTSGTGAASVTSTDNVAASADSDTGAAGPLLKPRWSR